MPAQMLNLLRPEDYAASRSCVFPSEQSIRWYLRVHRRELVETGALTCPNRAWLVDPELFDQAVLAIGQRRASAAVAAAGQRG